MKIRNYLHEEPKKKSKPLYSKKFSYADRDGNIPPWRDHDREKKLKPMSKLERRRARNEVVRLVKTVGLIKEAARRLSINPKTVEKWLVRYDKFAERIAEAEEAFVDSLEVEAIERARAKSDSLLKSLLEAYRPEKFHSRTQAELLHKGGGAPVQVLFSPGEVGEADDGKNPQEN